MNALQADVMLPLRVCVQRMREQEDPAARYPDLTLYLAQKDAAKVLPELTINPALLRLKVISLLPCAHTTDQDLLEQQLSFDFKAIPLRN